MKRAYGFVIAVILLVCSGCCSSVTGRCYAPIGTVTGALIGGALGGRHGALLGAGTGAIFDTANISASENHYDQKVLYGQTFYPEGERIIYYDTYRYEPPFWPTYPITGYYYRPMEPNFIFFIGRDGRHYRHYYHPPRNPGRSYRYR